MLLTVVDNDSNVDLHVGSSLTPALLTMPHFRTLALFEIPRVFRHLPFLVLAPIKVAIQVLTILYTLLVQIPHPPEYIMVQVCASLITVRSKNTTQLLP